jgi:hypothetical protein
MYIINEQLKIFSKKEIMSKSFATKFARKLKASFIDCAFTTTSKGTFLTINDSKKKLSSYGILKTRSYVYRYINSVLGMGHNIATQSVDNVKTDEDWFVVFNNIFQACGYKPFDTYENTKIKPFMSR